MIARSLNYLRYSLQTLYIKKILFLLVIYTIVYNTYNLNKLQYMNFQVRVTLVYYLHEILINTFNEC